MSATAPPPVVSTPSISPVAPGAVAASPSISPASPGGVAAAPSITPGTPGAVASHPSISPGTPGAVASYTAPALGAFASLTTALSGDNNDLVFTMTNAGAHGNDASVRYVDPGGFGGTFSMSVVHEDGGAYASAEVTVTPGSGATLTINGRDYVYVESGPLDARQWTTVLDLMQAINGEGEAEADPDVEATGLAVSPFTIQAKVIGAAGNAISIEGASGVSVPSATLTGGVDNTQLAGPRLKVHLARTFSGIQTTGASLLASVEADAEASAIFTVALAPGNDGSGRLASMAGTNLTGGAGIAPPLPVIS